MLCIADPAGGGFVPVWVPDACCAVLEGPAACCCQPLPRGAVSCVTSTLATAAPTRGPGAANTDATATMAAYTRQLINDASPRRRPIHRFHAAFRSSEVTTTSPRSESPA